MTIELTIEEAQMLGKDLDYFLTLVHYDWPGEEDDERHKQFLEALRDQLLAS